MTPTLNALGISFSLHASVAFSAFRFAVTAPSKVPDVPCHGPNIYISERSAKSFGLCTRIHAQAVTIYFKFWMLP